MLFVFSRISAVFGLLIFSRVSATPRWLIEVRHHFIMFIRVDVPRARLIQGSFHLLNSHGRPRHDHLPFIILDVSSSRQLADSLIFNGRYELRTKLVYLAWQVLSGAIQRHRLFID